MAIGPNNKSSNNAIMSHADAPSKNQVDQGKTSAGATKMARKGRTATQASHGTRQATTPGRAAQQSHQNRLTNIFSSSRQMWPEEQENIKLGHQNRPAIHRLPPQHVRNHRSHVYRLNTPIITPTNEQKYLLHPTSKGAIHKQLKTDAYVQSRTTGAGHNQALQRV